MAKLNDSSTIENIQSTIHQVITKWIDPVSSKKLEIETLQEAYDVLINTCHLCASLDFQSHDLCWLKVQCDLYRSLIVTSFLLLLQNASECDILKNLVEKSILLLRILVGAESESDLPHKLPPSEYQLLNSLILEPLIPLSEEGRKELWLLHEKDNDDEESTSLAIPNKKELLQEEQQLIRMAERPIPTNWSKENKSQVESKQELLLPGDILWKGIYRSGVNQNELLILRCGALQNKTGFLTWLTKKSTISKNGDINIDKIDLVVNEQESFQIERNDRLIQALDLAKQQICIREGLCEQVNELWKTSSNLSS